MGHHDVDVPPDDRRALDALSVLSGKWHPVVLAVLAHHGSAGFNDVLAAIPDVSGKVLSDTLDSLQESGLVERTVVSESPLRVEYELTDAGAGIEPVFDELSAWRDRHRESVAPTVLVAESDRRTTEMYSGWLSERYAVVRAHDAEGIRTALDDGVDVALFAARIPGVDPTAIPDYAGARCRTILLLDDRPGLDVLTVDADDVLRKPLLRETTLAAVERQLRFDGDTPPEHTRDALATKRAAVEDAHPAETLADDEHYRALCDRIETLEDRIEE